MNSLAGRRKVVFCEAVGEGTGGVKLGVLEGMVKVAGKVAGEVVDMADREVDRLLAEGY
jgi:hypothetical protein